MHDLILDDELRSLFPVPQKKEYDALEESIVCLGCPRPLLVWRSILLTDYIIYDICKKWDIPFEITRLNLPTRDDAMVITCRHIIKYQDIPTLYYRYIVGKCFLSIKNIMADVSSNRRENPFPPVSESNIEKAHKSVSGAIAASIFYINPGTASQYGAYATALDNIRSLKPEIAKKVFKKEYHLSLANMISFGKMTAEEMQITYDYTKDKKDSGASFLQIKKKLDLQSSHIDIKGRGRRPASPKIKQMPQYDPDAEISSLSLTIPMWVSSMKRTLSIAKFDQATPNALCKLEERLSELSNAIHTLHKAIEEAHHE